jgi:hypothetical protein
MRWLNTEYILKGAFLGLLLGAALAAPTWQAAGLVALWLLAGLAAALLFAGGRRIAQGVRPAGRWGAFLILLILESPTTIYAGLLLGLIGGAVSAGGGAVDPHTLSALAGGAVYGAVLGALPRIGQPWRRLVLAGLIAALAVIVAVEWIEQHLDVDPARRQTLGAFLLLGLPFFYLLVLAGEEEETEVEIAALCGGIALGVWLLRFPGPMPPAGLFIPLFLYILYATKVLPGLRVFKHTLRGFGHLELGRTRQALASFRRAVQLDPGNALARRGLERLHRGLDLGRAARDPELLPLLDYDLCLAWAESHLLGERPPTEAQRAEAARLLDLVAGVEVGDLEDAVPQLVPRGSTAAPSA